MILGISKTFEYRCKGKFCKMFAMLSRLLLGNENRIKQSSIIWNSVGGALFAGQPAIILVFISHRMGNNTAGIVTISYAVATIFMSIGKYGIRNFQVTNNQNGYSFGDYFWSRCITIAVSLFIAAGYVAYCYFNKDYSIDKAQIMYEIIILKMIDAFIDVYYGRFQQIGRLDIGSRIMSIHCFSYMTCICVMVVMGFNIHVCLLCGICTSILMGIIMIASVYSYLNVKTLRADKSRIISIHKICFPLCIGLALSFYVGNIPKYLIDDYMNEEAQAIFGYIMMPVFVVTLLNQFIYQPTIKELGDLWNNNHIKMFKTKILKQCIAVFLMTILIAAVGLLIGLPALSIMYHTNLSKYRAEFEVLLIGGGLYALAYYLNVPITIIQKQQYVAFGYIVALIISMIFGKGIVTGHKILGAALLYLVINIILVVLFFVIIIHGINKSC